VAEALLIKGSSGNLSWSLVARAQRVSHKYCGVELDPMGELRPFARFEAGSFGIYLSDGLAPLLRVSGSSAKAMFEALAGVLGNSSPDGTVPIPPYLFPSVAAWSVAAIGYRDPKALLEKALKCTSRVVADAVWELAYLSSLKRRGRRGRALIDGRIARQAAKHLRVLLELYHEVVP
jgi:hypothetical protein